MAQFEPAISNLQAALVAADQVGDQRHRGHILSTLGAIHWRLSNLRQAADDFEQALVSYAKIGDQRSLITALSAIGAIRDELGDFKAAERAHRDAMEISIRVGNDQASDLQARLANITASQRDVESP